MLIKKLVTLVFSLFLFGGINQAFSSSLPQQDEIQMERYKSDTFNQLSSLSNGNEAVLNQYNLFADALIQVYAKGEGMIESDIHKIFNAVVFAAQKHRTQTRKDPQHTPYIIHPIGVAHHMLKVGRVRDPDILIGGLLHDTVEDTETTFDEIKNAFGPRVESFVREVTDDKSLPKAERKLLQIVNASHKSAGGAQIKLADKFYNVTDLRQNPPSDWTQERIDQYFVWAKQVVDALPWVNAPLKEAFDNTLQ